MQLGRREAFLDDADEGHHSEMSIHIMPSSSDRDCYFDLSAATVGNAQIVTCNASREAIRMDNDGFEALDVPAVAAGFAGRLNLYHLRVREP
jgi:hypothetical protein